MKWDLLGKIRLLIVDDDPFNRQLVVSLLDKIPTIVFMEAGDGLEALSILRQTSIDMILLDLHMPRMDGYDTLIAIKKESNYDFIPVAIVTTDEQEMNKLYALGADDFISKPFKLSELESRIYAHIEKKQYRKKYYELSHNKIEKTVIDLKENEEEIEEEIEVEEIKEESVHEEKIEEERYDLEVIERTQKEIFYSMAKMLSLKNKNLKDIQTVAYLSKALSLLWGYDKRIANIIYYATFIKEIGGVSLNEKVPSVYNFSKLEKEEVNKAIVSGYKLLNLAIKTDFIKVAKIVMLQSKEHFNGLGFPKEYQGNQVHNIAYIVSLIETFNGLCSHKEYFNQKTYTEEETYALLKSESGKRFHPKITDLFLTHFQYFIGLREKIIKQNL